MSQNRDRVVFWTCLLALIALFGWLAHANTYFTDSYDLLITHKNDDYSYYMELEYLRQLFTEGQWFYFLWRPAFHYGSLYWDSMALLTLPFMQHSPDWVGIVLPRTVALGAFFASLFFFFKLLRQRGVTAGLAALTLILLCTCPNHFFEATRFQNNTIVVAFVLASLYLLSLESKSFWRIAAALTFGLGVGVKVTALLALPIYMLFLYQRKGRRWWHGLEALVLMSVVAATVYTPVIWTYPVHKNIDVLHSFVGIAHSAGDAASAGASFSENIEYYFEQNYHLAILSLAVLCFVWALFQSRRQGLREWIAPIAGLYSVPVILLAAKFVNRDAGVTSYIMATNFFIAWCLAEQAQKRKWGALGIASLAGLNIILNSHSFYEGLNRNRLDYYEDRTAAERLRMEQLKKTVLIGEHEKIVTEREVLFPIGLYKNFSRIRFIEAAQEGPLNTADIFVFSKNSSVPKYLCDEGAAAPAAYCDEVKNLYGAQKNYTKVYEDQWIYVLRPSKATKKTPSPPASAALIKKGVVVWWSYGSTNQFYHLGSRKLDADAGVLRKTTRLESPDSQRIHHIF